MAAGISILVVIHCIIAFFLIVFVLMQDGKSGGLWESGAGSQTLFGATGAANLLVKITRGLAIAFMISCLLITYTLNRKIGGSVVDEMPAAAGVNPVATPPPPAAAAPQPSASPENK